MEKSELLFEIGKACPDLADEILALLKRLDKNGDFHGPAKEANEKRFAKLCRGALETGDFTGEIWSKLKGIEDTLAGLNKKSPGDEPGHIVRFPLLRRLTINITFAQNKRYQPARDGVVSLPVYWSAGQLVYSDKNKIRQGQQKLTTF